MAAWKSRLIAKRDVKRRAFFVPFCCNGLNIILLYMYVVEFCAVLWRLMG